MTAPPIDTRMLDLAARAAWRAFGHAEPNPLVGCVIATPQGRVLGVGHHRRFGETHAEVDALEACARAGRDPRGATAWVTLEPCDHTGDNPPCTRALIDAGIARVVIAQADPNPVASGGGATLREAGVEVVFSDASAHAVRLGEPFLRRIRAGRPWVTVKWAQTIDGRIATSSGASQWISCERSRLLVHRLRGRVDAVLTGVGSVLADDPRLTARGVRVRRVARRVVVDPDVQTPPDSALVRTISEAALTICCAPDADAWPESEQLRGLGAEVAPVPLTPGHTVRRRLDLEALLRGLWERHQVARVLVEAGPGLLASMFEAGLVDEALVFVAPMLLGDTGARSPVEGRTAPTLADGLALELVGVKRCGADVALLYRCQSEAD